MKLNKTRHLSSRIDCWACGGGVGGGLEATVVGSWAAIAAIKAAIAHLGKFLVLPL